MARSMRVFVGVVLAVSCAGWAATALLQNSTGGGSPPGPYATPPTGGPGCPPGGEAGLTACEFGGATCEELADRIRRTHRADDESVTDRVVICTGAEVRLRRLPDRPPFLQSPFPQSPIPRPPFLQPQF